MNKSDISGFLERKRVFFFWSKRFCSLSGTTFQCFKDEEMSKLDIEFHVSPQTKVDILLPPQDFKFQLSDDGQETQVYKADSKDQLMRWVLALRGCTFENPNISMSMFRILSVIGRGFYGKVMLCQSNETNEVVAIKTIHKSRLIMSNKVHTVIAERNILAKAAHPFIVSLRFAFQTPSKFYLGLEFASGGELFFHIQKRGSFPIADVRIYIAEIALALNHLHELGILYRDLKPENILLDDQGHIKLTDFGLSKDMDYSDSTNTFCGTSEYLAPEIIKKERYGIGIDWWALGILTYELLFGITPFCHSNRARLFQNIIEKEPAFHPSVSPETIQFITLLLTKDPMKRPTFGRIVELPFFEGMNFDDVLSKKYKPSFIPRVENRAPVNNFDSEFTKETPADSFVMPVMGSAEQFPGFSYVDNRAIDSPLSPNSDPDPSSNSNIVPSVITDNLLAVSPPKNTINENMNDNF